MEKTVWQTMASRPDMARPPRKKALSEGTKMLILGAVGGAFFGLLIGAGLAFC